MGRSRDANGLKRPLFELPGRRWQGIEAHLVDMASGCHTGTGPTSSCSSGCRQFGHPADELASFCGRFRREDLPELPPWG